MRSIRSNRLRGTSLRAARRVALLAGCAVLGVPVAASAATRYAEPAGNGAEPCLEGDPCEIQTAVEDAASGDEVRILPGTYNVGADKVLLPPSVSVGGMPGAPRPLVVASGLAFDAFSDGTTRLHDVEVMAGGSYGIYAIDIADRVRVLGTGPGTVACSTERGGLLRNSICEANNSFGRGVEMSLSCFGPTLVPTVRLRNVTAIATGPVSVGVRVHDGNGCDHTIEGRNVIAQGTQADLQATSDSEPGSRAAVELDYSAFATTDSPEANEFTSAPGSASNITAAPLFVDAASGDFHQLPASPTIDAGTRVANIGPLDYDGEARVQGGSPDIGADEFDAVPSTKIKKPRRKALRTRRARKRVRFVFRADEPATFRCKVDRRPWRACGSPKRVRLKSARGKGKRHRFKVRATDGTNQTGPAAVWRGRVKRV